MKQVTSGWAVIASSTLCLARAWSTSSARTSTIWTFEPYRLTHAFDALTRIVGGRQTDEAHALAAVGQCLEGELARLLASVRVARADVGDALGFRRIAVGGEQRDLLGDVVERFRLGLRVDGADHDGADTRGDEVVHQALLGRRGRLLGIFEHEIVVGQLALRLLDAGFGILPEVGGAVHDESQRLLVGSLRARRKRHRKADGDTGQ